MVSWVFLSLWVEAGNLSLSCNDVVRNIYLLLVVLAASPIVNVYCLLWVTLGWQPFLFMDS